MIISAYSSIKLLILLIFILGSGANSTSFVASSSKVKFLNIITIRKGKRK